MLELKWRDHLPDQTLEGGLSLLNELKWNLEIKQVGKFWHVTAGHKALLKTSSRDAVDSFLYGMALAYSVVPDPSSISLGTSRGRLRNKGYASRV